MDSHLETEVVRLNPEYRLEYCQMTAAAHRQELGKALNKSKNHRLKPLHTKELFPIEQLYRIFSQKHYYLYCKPH